MPKARILTTTFLESLDAPTSGRAEYADTRVRGLALRISTSGDRVWCFRFRDPTSARLTRYTIGDYRDVSLAKARERAKALREQVAAGTNPVTQKRRERTAAATRTFEALATRYLDEHARRHKRSAEADERNLKLHVLPRWKDRRFDEIGRGDVIELLEGLMAASKPS